MAPGNALAPGLLLAPHSGEMLTLDPALERAIRARMRSIPIFASLGFSNERLGAGAFACTVARNKAYDGIFDSFHGGLLMTAADSAAAIVCLTLWGEQSRITTTDMNIRFLAPCLTSVIADAKLIKFGRSIVPVTVTMRDSSGREVALAQVAYMRLERMPSR